MEQTILSDRKNILRIEENKAKIVQAAKLIQRTKKDLNLLLFQYNDQKKYKEDGYGTFAQAFRDIQADTGIDIMLSSVRNNHYIYRSYQKYGFSIGMLSQYSHYRLQKLKPYLVQLASRDIPGILEKPAAEFNKLINQLNNRKEAVN